MLSVVNGHSLSSPPHFGSRNNRSSRRQPQQLSTSIPQLEYHKKALYNKIIMDVDNDEKMTSTAEEKEEASENSQLSPLPTAAETESAKNRGGSGRRGVMFKSRESIEAVKRISRISSRSLDEVIAYWGTTDEHKLRKQELRQAATEMQMNRRMSDNMEFTTLGLADKVGEGKMLKKQHRHTSREAVLDEQDLQYHEGVVDDELLADVYSSVTYGSQKEAAQKAAMLHEEVKKF